MSEDRTSRLRQALVSDMDRVAGLLSYALTHGGNLPREAEREATPPAVPPGPCCGHPNHGREGHVCAPFLPPSGEEEDEQVSWRGPACDCGLQDDDPPCEHMVAVKPWRRTPPPAPAQGEAAAEARAALIRKAVTTITADHHAGGSVGSVSVGLCASALVDAGWTPPAYGPPGASAGAGEVRCPSCGDGPTTCSSCGARHDSWEWTR